MEKKVIEGTVTGKGFNWSFVTTDDDILEVDFVESLDTIWGDSTQSGEKFRITIELLED